MTEQVGSDHGSAFKWRWALPLVPIAVSMFWLSALVYYHTAMGGNGAAWGFFQGAVVFSYRWLGFVPTFMFWLLLFVWCSIWFVTGRWDSVRTRLLWLGAFTLAIAILVNLGAPTDPPPHAGVIGSYIAVRLTSVIGYAFGALLAVAAALASLLLATDFLFYRYFEALARGRATEEAGVEPEATDAFRELAFSGVYAEQPRPAHVSEIDTAGAVALAPQEPSTDDAFSQDLARAVEQDVVVRPRRRRREPPRDEVRADTREETREEAREEIRQDSAPAAASTEDSDAGAQRPPLDLANEFGIVDPDAVVADEPASASLGARDDLVETASEAAVVFDGAFPIGAAPVASDDEGAYVIGDEPDEAIEGEIEAETGAPEPTVEIPRNPSPRQGSLFAQPAPQDEDFDRAAREVLSAGRASVTLLRRHLRCSATVAMQLLDELRTAGIIDGEPGSPNGRPLTTLADWETR